MVYASRDDVAKARSELEDTNFGDALNRLFEEARYFYNANRSKRLPDGIDADGEPCAEDWLAGQILDDLAGKFHQYAEQYADFKDGLPPRSDQRETIGDQQYLEERE